MNFRAVAMFSACAVLGLGQTTREAEVTKAHQEFQKSWSNFDVSKIEQLLADDLVWLGAFSDQIRDRTTQLSGFKQRTLTSPQQEEQTRVRTFGDVGIVTALVTTKDDRDPNLFRKLFMTEVWVKQLEKWKLVSFHSSLLPAPRR
jgi:ketosteroid isomerase-like protein